MPTARVKACPHIESCVKTLKKQCLEIAEMFLNESEFSWNEDTKMVVVKKFVFDLWLKDHANELGITTLRQEEDTIEATVANEGVQSTQPQVSPTGCSQQKARKSNDS
ncbi:hypothetical protein L1049_027204 [Liquidambar formosana]|uniref:Uncharacterized protein n=1 Tax=Liquidambar formosana TaxID=63359 RepID=A0AAP0N893_LIQFO